MLKIYVSVVVSLFRLPLQPSATFDSFSNIVRLPLLDKLLEKIRVLSSVNNRKIPSINKQPPTSTSFHQSTISIVLSLNERLESMGKNSGAGGFYAVARGKEIGIFRSWDKCQPLVIGFPNARFKKFNTEKEAEAFIVEHRENTTSIESDSNVVQKTFSSSEKRFAPSASTSFRSTSSRKPRKTQLIEPQVKFSAIRGFIGGEMSDTQKRGLSTSSNLLKRSALRVTEDRVTGNNKRLKMDDQVNVDLSDYSVDEEGYVVVFTDGACTKNGKRGAKAGIGVWFGDNHHLNISEPVAGRQTNNTAEIQAAERAILQIKRLGIIKLKLMTDSQFTINCATKWIRNWKKSGWKLASGGAVKNQEDLEKLDKAMQGIQIKWSYVAGHKGHYGNEAADRLAVQGANMGR